jgi:hypothetical protein
MAAASQYLPAQTVPFNANTDGQFSLAPTADPSVDDATIAYTFHTGAAPYPLSTGLLHEKVNVGDLNINQWTGTLPVYDGHFTWQTPGGDELFGTLSGNHVLTTAPNFTIDFNFDLVGGTGVFAGSYGSGVALGTGAFTSASGGVSHISWNGSITLVPEPGTSALLGSVVVFGVGGCRARRRRI